MGNTPCLPHLPFGHSGGTQEQGDFIQRLHQEERLAIRYAKLNYGSVSGSRLNTMKCIDLFNSKELDELAGKLSRAK